MRDNKRGTIEDRATDALVAPASSGKSWKLTELQAEQARLLAELERVGNEIALVLWADVQRHDS